MIESSLQSLSYLSPCGEALDRDRLRWVRWGMADSDSSGK